MEFIGEIFAFFLLLTFYTVGALSLWSTAQSKGMDCSTLIRHLLIQEKIIQPL